jgi:hypothetical protein
MKVRNIFQSMKAMFELGCKTTASMFIKCRKIANWIQLGDTSN